MAVTKINIKKVNSDKYDKKRGKWGTCFMYSVEYKWTKKEIKLMTTSILTVSVSYKKPQLIFNISTFTQGFKTK